MTVISADDLPLLGEPLPVELANSWYSGDDDVIDFLATPALVRLWFETASPDLVLPASIGEAEAAEIRGLRDTIRAILHALATGSRPPDDAIDAVNRAASRAPSFPSLRWTPEPHVQPSYAGTPLDVLVARVASAAIDFAVSSSVARLRRCAGLGCGMFYVQDHHRRRWCHESCGHRARQARYYRRTHGGSPP